MKKLKVIICGSTFAQFYMMAVSELPELFEFSGILAGGSSRSVACAERYQVPLYSSVEELPDDIDIACVVLRSKVMGGKGTELSLKLLEKGIHVIQEQPIHQKDLMQCVKTAKKSGSVFVIGDLYRNLPETKKFTAGLQWLLKQQNPNLISCELSSQLSFPFIDILVHSFSDIRPFSVKKVNENKSFVLLEGIMGKCPIHFQIHNWMNSSDPDNHLDLLYKITVGTDAGTLSLSDAHGPLMWYQRMHVPKEKLFVKEEEEGLILPSEEMASKILGNYKAKTYSQLFTLEWPQAVLQDLLYVREVLAGRKDIVMHYQKEMLSTKVWGDVTREMGYAEFVEKEPQKEIVVSELEQIVKKTEQSAYDQRLNHLAEENTEPEQCVRYANTLLDKIDASFVRDFVVIFEETILKSMLYTFQNADIYTNPEMVCQEKKVFEKLNCLPQNEKILKRWFILLEQNGYLEKSEEGYRSLKQVSQKDLQMKWQLVWEMWTDKIGSPLTPGYLFNNVKELPGLIDGTVNATHLLFPEGKMELANALYKETISLKYLNRLTAELVLCLENQMREKGTRQFTVTEVGAGTGATTEVILERLMQYGRMKENTYVYTDVSNYFLLEAKKRYLRQKNMIYKEVDIDKDFVEQGLLKESTDIMIAAGVLNNSRDTGRVIRQLLGTLKEDGILLVIEATREFPEILISQAFMMEDSEDIRKEENTTFLTASQWKAAFLKEGASHVWILPEDGHVLDPFGQKLFMIQK